MRIRKTLAALFALLLIVSAITAPAYSGDTPKIGWSIPVRGLVEDTVLGEGCVTIDTIGGDYFVSVGYPQGGKVKFISDTYGTMVVGTGTITLQTDTYRVCPASRGYERFTITGLFDKQKFSHVGTLNPGRSVDIPMQVGDGAVKVDVQWADLQADIDIYLLNDDGEILAKATTPDPWEEVLTTNLSAGTYTLRLYNRGDDPVDYSLTVTYTHAQQYSISAGGIYRVKVTYVYDGDTVKVLAGGEEYKVRLNTINTPEIAHSGSSNECYGPEARNYTMKLNGKTIYLEFDRFVKDHYGRLLAYVWLTYPRDDENIAKEWMWNALLVKNGYACDCEFQNCKWAWLFRELEDQAKEQKIGMWGSCNVYSTSCGYYKCFQRRGTCPSP